MSELKPCPFCGGEPKLSIKAIRVSGQREHCAWVYCQNCNARTSYYLRRIDPTGYFRTAIRAWNARGTSHEE